MNNNIKLTRIIDISNNVIGMTINDLEMKADIKNEKFDIDYKHENIIDMEKGKYIYKEPVEKPRWTCGLCYIISMIICYKCCYKK